MLKSKFIFLYLLIFLLINFSFMPPLYADQRRPFIYPLKGRVITKFRDEYWHQKEQKYLRHTGIDIKGKSGNKIVAAGNGYVSYVGFSPIGGRTIVIEHNKKIRTTYLNLSNIFISFGDYVRQGEKIATIGAESDPSNTEVHLHFGVIYDGKYLDPEDLLSISYEDISKYLYLNYLANDFYIQTHLSHKPVKYIW